MENDQLRIFFAQPEKILRHAKTGAVASKQFSVIVDLGPQMAAQTENQIVAISDTVSKVLPLLALGGVILSFFGKFSLHYLWASINSL